MHILLILLILPNRVTLCGDSTMVFPTFVQGRVVVVPPRGQERIAYCMSTGLIQGALIGRRPESRVWVEPKHNRRARARRN